MKVHVSFTIDIDPAAWTANYGIEGRADIRTDVKQHAEHIVWSQFHSEGLIP